MLIDLSGIDELAGIDGQRRRACASAPASRSPTLARDPAIAARYRAVAQAAAQVAGPGHRAMATVGGNLCLDTRCIYYNQSEWWRRANKYCLKHAATSATSRRKASAAMRPSAAILRRH